MRIGMNCLDWDPLCTVLPSFLVDRCLGGIGPTFHRAAVSFLFVPVWMSSLCLLLCGFGFSIGVLVFVAMCALGLGIAQLSCQCGCIWHLNFVGGWSRARY